MSRKIFRLMPQKSNRNIMETGLIILLLWILANSATNAAEVTTSDGITYDDETYQLISYDSSVSTSVRIPDGVTTIPSNTNLFRDSGVTSVDLNGVTRIEAYAFRGSSLSSVTGDAVEQIGDQAFADTNLTTFSVPEGLTVLSQNAFRGTGITSFSGGGGNYRGYGGSIYSDSGATLYIVPEGKTDSVIVSDTATKIASGALSGATRVTDIYIPSSVTTIEDGATTGSGVIAPNGTIFGYTGTAAETYANSHNIRFSALNNSNSGTNNNTDNSNNANNDATDWYMDYTYAKDDIAHTITVSKYNGSNTALTVPASTIIDSVNYATILTGDVYCEKEKITDISFEDGVKFQGDMSDLFAYCNSLRNIELSGVNTETATSMDEMFCACSSLTSLDLSNFSTSNVTSLSGMFLGCSSLTSLDLRGFDTAKVTDLSYMFWGCSGLTSLDLSRFETDNVIYTGNMFEDCSNLKDLDMSNCFMSNNVDMDYMFANCSNLTSLDLSSFYTEQELGMDHMFSGCSSLVSIDLSTFDMSNIINIGLTTGLFYNCNSLNTIKTPMAFDRSTSAVLPHTMYEKKSDGTWGTIAYTDLMDAPASTTLSVKTATNNGTSNGTSDTSSNSTTNSGSTYSTGGTTTYIYRDRIVSDGSSSGSTPNSNTNIYYRTSSYYYDDDDDDDEDIEDDADNDAVKINPTHITKVQHHIPRSEVSITWKKVKKANGYIIQYSENSKFNNAKKKGIRNASTTTVRLKDLTINKKCYIRVRAFKTKNGKKICSDWNKISIMI